MRAKFIYEKFTQDSDPIEDLDIGFYKILEKHSIKYKFQGGTEKDIEVLEQFFQKSAKKIYFLGESQFSLKPGSEIFKKIQSMTKLENAIFHEEYIDSYKTSVFGFKTKNGKILYMESKKTYSSISYYFGDVEMAIYLNLHELK